MDYCYHSQKNCQKKSYSRSKANKFLTPFICQTFLFFNNKLWILWKTTYNNILLKKYGLNCINNLMNCFLYAFQLNYSSMILIMINYRLIFVLFQRKLIYNHTIWTYYYHLICNLSYNNNLICIYLTLSTIVKGIHFQFLFCKNLLTL